jgi:hypothetical protein
MVAGQPTGPIIVLLVVYLYVKRGYQMGLAETCLPLPRINASNWFLMSGFNLAPNWKVSPNGSA